MSSLINIVAKGINIKHIWVFITNRCNLKCDYCFLKREEKEITLPFSNILSLLRILPRNNRYDFIISGGEPLLYWSLVQKIVTAIKEMFPSSEITLQTNTILLTADKIRFFKTNDLVIEPGLDGDFLVNRRHRIGITPERYEKCLKGISLLVNAGLRMNPTMTVHPQEVNDMFHNFNKLLSLGLNCIDVHPAFMANWDQDKTDIFIREYKKMLTIEYINKRYLICKSYSAWIRPSFDLVIQPDGFILPNWTYLIFPYRFRKEFFIMRLSGNRVNVDNENLSVIMKKLKVFFGTKRSYREFSNFNAALILKNIQSSKAKERFLTYRSLCGRIQLLDRMFLRREDTSQ